MACKGYATKYKVLFTFIYLNAPYSNAFAHLKIEWSDTKGAMFYKPHFHKSWDTF